MAAETTPLPAIGSVQLTQKRGENVAKDGENSAGDGKAHVTKNEEVAAFLASVRLGSLQRQPRPGDVFRRSGYASSVTRPLGLIPDRGGSLPTGLLPPIYPVAGITSATAGGIERVGDVEEVGYYVQSLNRDAWERRTFRHPTDPTTGRFNRRAPSPSSRAAYATADDMEYADTLAKCKMQDYVASQVNVAQISSVIDPLLNRRRRTKTVPQTGSKLQRYADWRTGPMEYFSFINQANVKTKMMFLDQRYAEECEECERCRGRRGRCPRCLAIRVGGGYIILDGGELPEGRRHLLRNQYDYNWSGRRNGDLKRQSRIPNEFGAGVLSSGVSPGAVMGGEGGGNDGRGGERGGRGGWDSGEGRRGRLGGGWGDKGREDNTEYDSTKGGGMYGGEKADGEDLKQAYYGEDDGNDGGAFGEGKRGSGGSGLWDGDGIDSGRQSNLSHRPGSRMSSSRPGSRFGVRPPSSMRRTGTNRKKGVNTESGGAGSGDRQGGEDEEDGDRRRRGRRRRGGRGEEEEDEHGGERSGHGYRHDDDDLTAGKSGSLGDLMRFRSRKKDDVKALKATLKELQDIDPLDYLAKYCIIDQDKIPHYRRVYDNVDRDEDDEIDIFELDFALKAVNFDLISDSELSYVHSVLELAGRHRLNFRFFSLIAALSEKVVALDDMVKRLINKMDFEALEVKLQKCKELFYLLADTEHDAVEQGGVVTVASLAVELQAGGLTQEHVEYVCDHMNREDRGLVEFLDYLTYVPLFVEIHDNIYDNPLDFTRTK